MAGVGQVVLGMFCVSFGVLTAIDHPIITRFNRRVQSRPTTQSPSDIEFTETAIKFQRIAGTLLAVLGILFVIAGIS